MKRALVSWSGGKDSLFAAMQAAAEGYEIVVLLNVLNEEGKTSRAHGIPENILAAQAQVFKKPIHLIASSWQAYEQKFTEAICYLKVTYNLTHAIFGDIDLQPHRDWEEKVCRYAGLEAVLPLWKKNRKDLVLQMLENGIKTIIVSCNNKMGSRFLGKELSPELITELEALGIDPCGEEGEFHTLVTHCPLFQNPIQVTTGDSMQQGDYWYTQLHLIQK